VRSLGLRACQGEVERCDCGLGHALDFIRDEVRRLMNICMKDFRECIALDNFWLEFQVIHALCRLIVS
jgi:hypothetical protein